MNVASPREQSLFGADVALPAPDTVIVPGYVAFSDEAWDLTPLCPRPTTRWITLRFLRCPASLRDDLKHFFYLMLTVDTPLERLDRPASARKRLTPSTLKTLFEDIKPFLVWCDSAGITSLTEVTDDDLRAYAAEVANAPIGQNPKMRRLFAVSRLWLMAPYMRRASRVRQPFWERDGIEEVVGKSEWTAENKSIPIHPLTISALLAWCLRIVEDSPYILTALDTNACPQPFDGEHPAHPGGRWVGEITAADVASVRRVLSTACLLTVAYLTGMRSDEVLGLRRGCCTPIPVAGNGTVKGYEVRGRTYKSAVEDGRSIGPGVDRAVPWKAIKPVADALAVMEQLHSEDLLFSATLFRATIIQGALDPGGPTSTNVRESFDALVRWCNERSAALGRPEDSVPPDPDGLISLRRLRRTLAWFIYRKPQGRVALGIQYGHLHAATTDGYGSRASAGLRDLFPMEEAFSISDSLHRAAGELRSGTTVSGPAAQRYRDAAAEYQHQFEGLSLTPKQAAALMTNPKLRIYDAPGQALACCFDPQKALCRSVGTNPRATTKATPDLTACNDKCANIARSDRHIDQLRDDVAVLHDEHSSPLTPMPLRHRIEIQIERREDVIRKHAQPEGVHAR